MDIDNDKREWLLHWNYVTPQNSGVRAEDTKIRSLKMHSFSMTSCNFYIEEGKEYEAKSRKIVVGVSFILLFWRRMLCPHHAFVARAVHFLALRIIGSAFETWLWFSYYMVLMPKKWVEWKKSTKKLEIKHLLHLSN